VNINKSYRLFSLVMAVLLFISSSGISMDMHFCQGKLKRVSFIGSAKTCAEMAAMMKHCSSKKGKSCHNGAKSCSADGTHKGCCENESLSFDLDIDNIDIQNFNSSVLEIDFNVLSKFQLVSIPNLQIKLLQFEEYIPPLSRKDLTVLYQSFLI